MAIIKPFKGLRPPKHIAANLASLPYDVMNSEEAAQMAKNKPESLLHITRAEIDCPPGTDIHSETVYKKAAENFQLFKNKGWLIPDSEPMYYIYAQTMGDRTQYGIVGAAACEDYENGIIKKHELTRPDKEEDRMILTKHLNANIAPVFFTYNAVPEIDTIVEKIVYENEPEYDFRGDEMGFGHKLWCIRDTNVNKQIEKLFATKVPYTYIADGHHRTAAAARVGIEMKAKNPNHTGNEPYNYFMAVHFPHNQLKIIDYNRVVKDLNGMSKEQFIAALKNDFEVSEQDSCIHLPKQLHEFGMYLNGSWYQLIAKERTYNNNDPIGVLDVTILSNMVLDKLLDIKDLRTTTRCEFVGGIRGLKILEDKVNSGNMKVAFALHPVSMQQLINIADTGNIMPPKTTWFEPKLRSGLVIYEL